MEKVEKTYLSQYANSPILAEILSQCNETIDPREDINQFYRMVFNIETAQGFGLDIWARIVGVNRALSIPNPNENYFGFSETDKYLPFNQAPFYGGGEGESTFQMDDTTFRNAILTKAYSNILYATAPNINAFLKVAFKTTRAYYLITGHMAATYVFENRLSEIDKNLIYHQNILPRPSGVGISIQELNLGDFFGFYGSGYQPFNQAPFEGDTQ